MKSRLVDGDAYATLGHFSLDFIFRPFWLMTSLKIQINFFQCCTVKSLRQKQKQWHHRNLPGWKIQRYFEQRIQVTSPFLFTVNFSILLLQVCFQFLTVTLNIILIQLVCFKTCAHAKLLRDHLKGFF